MSVFDHVYYPFHYDHINTPRKHPPDNPFELQMVGGCRVKTGGLLGGLDKSLPAKYSAWVDVHGVRLI